MQAEVRAVVPSWLSPESLFLEEVVLCFLEVDRQTLARVDK
jgi:hypothetical protein